MGIFTKTKISRLSKIHKLSINHFIIGSIIIHVVVIIPFSWRHQENIGTTKLAQNQKAQRTEIKMQFSFDQKVIPVKTKKLEKPDIQKPAIQKSNDSKVPAQKEITQKNIMDVNDLVEKVNPTILELYLSKIRALIESKKFYPASARRLQVEGDVTIKLKIDRNGKLLDLVFTKKAEFDPLNEAARSAANQIENFPPFPDEISNDFLIINQNISFKLRE